MPQYAYKVIGESGNVIKGQLIAESPSSARSLLREQGHTVLAVQTSGQKRRSLDLTRSPSTRALGRAVRQLSVLLRGGLPTAEALDSLAEGCGDSHLERALGRVRDRVVEGKSVSEAMAEEPRAFDAVLVSMVRVGEATGRLGDVLEDIAQWLEKQDRMRGRLISVLTYPAVTLLFGTIVIGYLVGHVVPEMRDTLQLERDALPFSTDLLLTISEFLQAHWLMGAGLCVFAMVALRMAVRTKRGRLLWHRLRLTLPGFGSLWRKQILTRITLTLGVLLRSGIDILESLSITADASRDAVYENDLRRVRNGILEGGDLSAALNQPKLYPRALGQLVAVGEKSGNVDRQLEEIGLAYDQDVETAAQRFADLLGPVMLVLLGGLVGFIMAAILSPLSQFGEF